MFIRHLLTEVIKGTHYQLASRPRQFTSILRKLADPNRRGHASGNQLHSQVASG
jgi:hypothetical protein